MPVTTRNAPATNRKHRSPTCGGQCISSSNSRSSSSWTSLDRPTAEIRQLYRGHGTSEQFHSEFKSDLDMERLPSGKFDTNNLILGMAAFAYNILRCIGVIGLMGKISPVRHPAKRRRLKTVIQELMYLAACLITTGRRLKLRFSRHCPAFEAFQTVYAKFAYG